MKHHDILSFVLLEDITFKELVNKMSAAFCTQFEFENDEGRLIAIGDLERYKIFIIDKYDDLGEFMCDENYTIDIKPKDDVYNKIDIESKVVNKFKYHNILWKRGIWTPSDENNNYKEIFPD